MSSGPADDEAWDRVVRRTYDLDGVRFARQETDVRLFRVRRGRSLSNAPYLEYGGANFPTGGLHRKAIDELLAMVDQLQVNHILLKAQQRLCEPDQRVHIDSQYVHFHLDLSGGASDVWTHKLLAKTRNQVRKAEARSFRERVGGEDLVDDFYQVLCQCWRDLGTPVHARAMFSNIAQEFGNRCQFQLIYDADKPIAGALLLDINGVRHHPFAGTLKAYKPTSVNNLLYWRIIEDACRRGLKGFDMGRSAVNSGTFRYKRSWGGEALPLYYHYLLAAGARAPDLQSGLMRACTGAWRYVPVPVTTLIGPQLIRYIL